MRPSKTDQGGIACKASPPRSRTSRSIRPSSELLPCNVIVREESPGQVVVGFLDPKIMVPLVERDEIRAVADATEERLRRACESLGGTPIERS